MPSESSLSNEIGVFQKLTVDQDPDNNSLQPDNNNVWCSTISAHSTASIEDDSVLNGHSSASEVSVASGTSRTAKKNTEECVVVTSLPAEALCGDNVHKQNVTTQVTLAPSLKCMDTPGGSAIGHVFSLSDFNNQIQSKHCIPLDQGKDSVLDGGDVKVNHIHCKRCNLLEQGKDVLLIGGDLLISKTERLPRENSSSISGSKDGELSPFKSGGSLCTNSLTIKTINYRCRILQQHSRECQCRTPRLHEYLKNRHKCSQQCVPSSQPTVDIHHVLSLNKPPATKHDVLSSQSLAQPSVDFQHVLSVRLPTDMTGRSRGKPRGRKMAASQKMSKERQINEIVLRNGSTMERSVLDRQLTKMSVPVSRNLTRFTNGGHETDEPESELLGEGDCEWLPSTMSTLEGVEYIVLDDNALNLSSATHCIASPDALKSKINIIYKDIDEKPDICGTESGTTINEVKFKLSRKPELNTHWSNLQGHRTEMGGTSVDGSSEQITENSGSSSLAVVCTNHSPSIKDIFGDINIKEEPLEDVNKDMSFDDFSKDLCISKISDEAKNFSNGMPIQKKDAGSDNCNDGSGKELFAKLIKEENIAEDEMNCDLSSDDSFAPLRIDEEKYTSSVEDITNISLKDVTTTELSLPSVNIISPIKIKILLGSANREPHLVSKNVVETEVGNPPDLDGTILEKKIDTDGKRIRHEGKKEMVSLSFRDTILASPSTPSAIRSFTCKYCNVHCPSDQALAEHFENHQKEGLIICYFCQKSFGDKTGMKRHMRVHTGEKPYQCKVCGKRFSLPGNFKKHRDIHEDRRTEPCNVCGKTFRRKEHLKYHMRTHTGEKPYTCGECGTSFTARYSLQIHMNIHLGKKPYKCSYCSKAFSDKSTMRKHVRVHTGEKPFRCQECRRCFGESGTLAAHMATHRSDRPYKCDKCDLCFKTMGGLRQHEKVHTGEKQFACKYCGMKFLQKYNMTMHERIHTGEKPYTCSHCDRSFRSRSCLAKHVVLHGGDDERRFGCDHCNSRFYRKAHLRRHIDMHLGIKNFECNMCSKKFCTRGTLKSHLKTFHSHGARRFPCNWCGRVFKRKVYVSTHVCNRATTIKTEGAIDTLQDLGEPGTSQYHHLNSGYISSESDASSVEIKSEPDDEFMVEDKTGTEDYDFVENMDDDDIDIEPEGTYFDIEQSSEQNDN